MLRPAPVWAWKIGGFVRPRALRESPGMALLLIEHPAAGDQIASMLEELDTYIKVAVDVARGILAGGCEYHADCEEVLLRAGSRQEDVWGADWYPETRIVGFESLINIRPRQGNRRLEIENPDLRRQVEAIVVRLLGGGHR